MTQKTKPHLVIISIDALNEHDWPILKTLPNFQALLATGTHVTSMDSVYPTLTYTCHTSMITGTYPHHHGIYTNEKPTPDDPLNQPWHWFEKDIKVPTLFDYANQAGMTTANVLWPVMTKGPITYNVPEVWSVAGKSYASELIRNTALKSLPFIFRHMRRAKGSKQPNLDNFIQHIAMDMIKRKQPNLLTLHLFELDQIRHTHGLSGPHIQTILKRMDERVGALIQATKEAGIYADTTFVVCGDHGGNNFEHVIRLNAYLKEKGLKDAAYANGCGGSVQITMYKKADSKKKLAVKQALEDLVVLKNSPVYNLLDASEAIAKHHLSGPFDYVLEAKDGYCFRNDFEGPYVQSCAMAHEPYCLDHGYDPAHPNLKTLMIIAGPKVKQGHSIDKACLVDMAPTLASCLGLHMDLVDGTPLDVYKV